MNQDKQLFKEKVTACMNMYYHNRASRYFDIFNRIAVYFSFFFSLAAVGALFELLPVPYSSKFTLFITVFVTAMNAAVLILNVQDRVLRHENLRKEWTSLYTDIDRMSLSPDKNINKELLDEIFYRANEITKQEPTAFKVWLDYAQEEACKTIGIEFKKPKRKWWQSILLKIFIYLALAISVYLSHDYITDFLQLMR